MKCFSSPHSFAVDYQPYLLQNSCSLSEKFAKWIGQTAAKLPELLCEHYGSDRSQQMVDTARRALSDLGIAVNPDRPLIWNTVPAHCLAQYARSIGLQAETAHALLHSYFIDAADISDIEVLLAIAKQLGMDVDRVRHVITDPACHQMIRDHTQKLRSQGVSGVPTFVLRNADSPSRFALFCLELTVYLETFRFSTWFALTSCSLRSIKISGSQTPDVFKQAIAQLLEEPGKVKPSAS